MTLPRALTALAWLFTLCTFAWVTLLREGSVGEGDVSIFFPYGVFTAGCGAVLLIAFLTRRRPGPWTAIALVAPFFAITLFASPPVNTSLTSNLVAPFKGFLSDDYHRFLLDGELIGAGENPYHVVPADIPPGSPHHRAAMHVNHSDLATFYSPLAEAWFAVLAKSGLGRNGFVLGNLLAVALAILLLSRLGVRDWRLLLFALNPLLILEATIGYHFDPMVMVLLLGLAWCLDSGRKTGAAAFWAAAVGLKLFPLILAPIVLRRVGWLRTSLAVAVLGVIHIPFLNEQTFEVYRAFAEMIYNPSPIAMLLPPWLKLVVLAGVVLRFTRRPGAAGAAVFWPILTVILLSNTVQPWYAVWILPLALLRTETRWPVIAWSFLLFSAYAILITMFGTGVWAPISPVSTVVWLLFLWTLGLVCYERIRGRHPATSLLLVWPIVPLVWMAGEFETTLLLDPWRSSFPYLYGHFDLPGNAPYVLRVLAVAPVRLLSGLTGLGPVAAGSAILAAGHVTAALILHRILATGRHPGRATAGVVLYLLSPAFWLLPWGQLTGSLFEPPIAAWHFSQYAEGIYLPLAFLLILLIRGDARARVVVPLLLLLLATKDSAFFFVGAFWIVWNRYDLRATIPVVAMGLVYIVILKTGGHAYPEGVPTLFPAFAEGVLAKNGWALVFAGAWLVAIIRFALPGVAREDRVPLIAYAACLLCLSWFFETRLWLVTAPLLFSNVRYSADGP